MALYPEREAKVTFSVANSNQVFTLLDSVRDSNFLNFSTKDALGNTIPDAGLGVVDNGIFFNTTKFTPGKPTIPRPYPIKFFWIGSPAGTNDANDNFSIFMADVNEAAFFVGASPTEYMVNPRLVLSWQQAKNDIVNWFDTHYPYTTTPPSNGVGQEAPNGQSNSAYGTLSSGGNPGNVSGMNSIDGQFWPVYDYVDNSIILYFSFKTPNHNTKAIYAYKIADSEISSPVTSSQFLGGVYNVIYGYNSSTFSSHRFSIQSPEPYRTGSPVSGQQTAVFAYAFGAFDYTTPDHARFLGGGILADIHGSPLNWQSPTVAVPNYGLGLDLIGINNTDKLGSIFPLGSLFVSASYGILMNCVTDRDIRGGSNNVVINKMQLRVAYYHPSPTGGEILMGDDLSLQSGVEVLGACRPQFTTLPDGLPKLIYNVFNSDQSLKTVYEYIDVEKLKPENQKELVYVHDPTDAQNPFSIPTFGKKHVDIQASNIISGFNQNPQNMPTVFEIATWDGSNDYMWGYNQSGYNGALIMRIPSNPVTSYTLGQWTNFNTTALHFAIKNPRSWLAIKNYGNNRVNTLTVRLTNG